MQLINTNYSCFLLFLVAAISHTEALKLSFYTGGGCRGTFAGKVSGGPELGCRSRDFVGVGASVVVETTGDEDKNLVVVLFDSDNCDRNSIIGFGKEEIKRCVTGNYASYEIWDLSKSQQPFALPQPKAQIEHKNDTNTTREQKDTLTDESAGSKFELPKLGYRIGVIWVFLSSVFIIFG